MFRVKMVPIILQALSFADILNKAAEMQIFSYVLPFLLVFALVYAILIKSNILGDNKGAIVIISLALGLLSLVGDYFPNFIQAMSPKLAIALSLLIAVLVLLGLFVERAQWLNNLFIGVGILAFVIVAYSSLADYRFTGSWLWEEYGPALVTLIIIGIVIALIVRGSSKESS